MAEKDELTGLLNAGSLFRLLEQELQNAVKAKTSITVIVLDLDNFKQANDVHGHLAGNRVLREVANGLVACCRFTDHVARLGGDEFVLVLVGADARNVSNAVQRIRELGPEAGMMACGEPLITVSCGVAVYPQDGADAESLLEKADQRMYESKKEAKRGQDCIRLAEALGPAGHADSPGRSRAAQELDEGRISDGSPEKYGFRPGGRRPPSFQVLAAEVPAVPASVQPLSDVAARSHTQWDLRSAAVQNPDVIN